MVRSLGVAGLLVLIACMAGLAAGACTATSYLITDGGSSRAEAAVLQLISRATTSVDVVVPAFPQGAIGEAIRLAMLRGVRVRILLTAPAPAADLAWLNADELSARRVDATAVRALLIDDEIVIAGAVDLLVARAPATTYDVVVIDCSATAGAGSVAALYAQTVLRLWSSEASGIAAPGGPIGGESGIELFDVDPAGECITLLNVSSGPVDLAGWTLSDLEGRYTFPPSSWIPANDPVQICIATYNPTYDPNGVYLNDEHDEVYLATPNGDIVAETVW